ncbi:MAG: NAD(P)H-binding protein [Bacteroidota bacterium]
MPRILITGGSGEMGRQLAPRLLAAGQSVRILSRRPRPAGADPALEWVQASLTSGEGLPAAVADVDTIVHAASSPVGAAKIDTGGAARLLELTRGSQTNFFYISIVGVDRHPFFYYKAKYATEKLVEQSSAPWTILRATQFHAFIGRLILPVAYRSPFFMLPTDLVFQPIDEGEVAAHIVDLLQQGARGRAADIGGPQVLTLGELALSWLLAQKRTRRIIHISVPGRQTAAFRQGVHTAPDHKFGRVTWQQWLDKEYRVGF